MIEILVGKPFADLPPHNVRGTTESEATISVGRKVFLCFEPEALLNPDGCLVQYKIEFLPQGHEPFTVFPEPDKYYTPEEAVERAWKLLTAAAIPSLRFYLHYRLYGEQPSTIDFSSQTHTLPSKAKKS